jgi:transglutaminase/protease-like cytokinesis protein 3
MKDDIEKIYAKLVSLEVEVTNLRTGYIVVNQRYADAMGSLKALTASALEAAKRAAIAAEKALLAAKSSATAAKLAASESVIDAAEAAADAAAASAEAAATQLVSKRGLDFDPLS